MYSAIEGVKSLRIALVVTGNRTGYSTREPPETSRWFGYVPDMKADLLGRV